MRNIWIAGSFLGTLFIATYVVSGCWLMWGPLATLGAILLGPVSAIAYPAAAWAIYDAEFGYPFPITYYVVLVATMFCIAKASEG